MPNRRTIVLGALAVAAAGAAAVTGIGIAGRSRFPKPAIFTGYIDGVAAGGYDVVAYFAEGAPRPGRADITMAHAGVDWRFASEASRALFQADPDRYAPRYGGYCAYAVANGGTGEGDPKHWSVVDGKLYLNASQRVKGKWERDIPGYIRKADANWPGVLTN